jgi:hypothetical protein
VPASRAGRRVVQFVPAGGYPFDVGVKAVENSALMIAMLAQSWRSQ